MAEVQASAPSPTVVAKGTKPRSPNYPAIGLEDSVKRVKKLIDADGRAGSPQESAAKHIGYSGANGAALGALSALKKFGLLEDRGGKLAPTQLAIDITTFPEGHERRTNALQTAVQKPTTYKTILDEFRPHGQLPSDESLRPVLIADRGFQAKAVDGFLKDMRASLVYAGLLQGNKLILSGMADDKESDTNEREDLFSKGTKAVAFVPKIGDLVQWTAAGQDMFEEPRPIKGVSPTGEWVFVPGTETGIPVTEVTLAERNMDDEKPIRQAPPNPFAAEKQKTEPESHTPPPGFKEDAYDLAEGRATFRWPEKLDKESVAELEEWFELLGKKLRRLTGAEKKKL